MSLVLQVNWRKNKNVPPQQEQSKSSHFKCVYFVGAEWLIVSVTLWWTWCLASKVYVWEELQQTQGAAARGKKKSNGQMEGWIENAVQHLEISRGLYEIIHLILRFELIHFHNCVWELKYVLPQSCLFSSTSLSCSTSDLAFSSVVFCSLLVLVQKVDSLANLQCGKWSHGAGKLLGGHCCVRTRANGKLRTAVLQWISLSGYFQSRDYKAVM